MRLTLTKETLAELTADDLNAVVGGGGNSETCSCTIASCITRPAVQVTTVVVVDDANICPS